MSSFDVSGYFRFRFDTSLQPNTISGHLSDQTCCRLSTPSSAICLIPSQLLPFSNQKSTSQQNSPNSRSTPKIPLLSMAAVKRSMASDGSPSGDDKLKKIKVEIEYEKAEPTEDEETYHHGTGFVNLDDNLLYEILKHVDARSLATAACVSKLWNRTALDERLWELICTRHYAQVGCSTQQLRSVVLALGGFRRLHSLYLWPLSKPPPSSSSSSILMPRLTTAF